MEPKEQLYEAIKMINHCYKNEVDLDGNPAVLHPMKVGTMGRNYKETIVGLLHDIIEDDYETAEGLLAIGFDRDIVEAIEVLTKPVDKTYSEYIEGIITSGNEMAIKIKYEDLFTNLSRNGGKYPTLHKRHFDAFNKILDIYADKII